MAKQGKRSGMRRIKFARKHARGGLHRGGRDALIVSHTRDVKKIEPALALALALASDSGSRPRRFYPRDGLEDEPLKSRWCGGLVR